MTHFKIKTVSADVHVVLYLSGQIAGIITKFCIFSRADPGKMKIDVYNNTTNNRDKSACWQPPKK